MPAERKSGLLYDVLLFAVPLALVAAGIYFMRAPRVAVVNSALVAQKTGVSERIREGKERWRQSASSMVNEMNARLRTEAAALEAQAEKITDPEGKKPLQERMRRMQNEAQVSAVRLEQEFQQYCDDVRREFRTNLAPIVASIARSQRYDVVIDIADGQVVLYAHPSVNITSNVVDKSKDILAAADLGISGAPGKSALSTRTDAGKPADPEVVK